VGTDVITLSNGHKLEFVVASGALGWDGRGWWWERPLYHLGLLLPDLFTVTTKTITDYPRKGTRYKCLPLYGGVWNNIGLANPGFDWWVDKVAPRLDPKIPLLVSLYPSSLDFIKEACLTLSEYESIRGVELNFSCPNVKPFHLNTIQGFLRNFKYLRLPVVLKLNAEQVLIYGSKEFGQFIDSIKETVAAISLNSVPVSLLKGCFFKTGAISGRRIADINWLVADKIREFGFDNVIYPSVWSYKDVVNVIDVCKAKAVSFGSVHLLHPAAPSRWVKRYNREGAGALGK
jgi:hypothetical protein